MRLSLKLAAAVAIGIASMTPTRAAAAPLPPVTSGLVLYLDAENVNGSNNSGMVDGQFVSNWVNSAAANSANTYGAIAPTYVASGFGNNKPAVRFDGLTNVLGDTDSSLNVTGTGLTIFIVKHETTTAGAGGGFFGNYGGSGTGYYIAEDPTKFYFFAGASVSGGSSTATTNRPLILGALQDATTMTLYVNGSPVASGASASILSSGAPVGVGNDGRYYPSTAGGDGFWGGDYRDVLIYNRALSASEFASVQQFLATQAPEPSAAVALLAAAGSLFFRRRSR